MAALQRNATDHEVAIVGAGLVGLTLAALLGRANVNVALIDPQPPVGVITSKQNQQRMLAMTRASERILRAAGGWNAVDGETHGVFRAMEVWDESSRGHIRFDSAMIAEPALGYIVGERALRRSLESVVAAIPAVKSYRSATLRSGRLEDDRIVMKLTDTHDISARLAVGADGGDSKVRTLAGIHYLRNDYRQTAIVCNITTEKPHEDIARQRFLNTGPLAFLPLADPHGCSIVWTTTPQHAEALMTMSAEAFHVELAGAFEHRLGAIIESSARVAAPLFKARAQDYVRPRVALAGEAAHTIHPLAGQGANQGLLDAAVLAEVLTEAIAAGRDPGALRVLRRYERWRKGENLIAQLTMDGFSQLFGSTSVTLRGLRGLGLGLTDAAGPVKALIMHLASGLSGDLPAAARG